jgi:GTP-binding protein Era
LGIKTTADYQIMFSDTPGVLEPAYLLQETMMREVKQAVGDCDLIIFMTDNFGNEFADSDLFYR